MKKSLSRSFDDLAESGGKHVDDASAGSKAKGKLCRRKRMINAPSCSTDVNANPQKPKTQRERYLSEQAKTLAEDGKRRAAAQNRFNEINGSPTRFSQGGDGFVYDGIAYKMPDNVATKDLLHELAYYHDYIKDGATIRKPARTYTNKKGVEIHKPAETLTGKYALKVDMKFGDEPFEFIMFDSSKAERQIFINFPGKTDFEHTYEHIIKVLSEGNPQQNAATILKMIEAPGNRKIDWGAMSPAQREAAKEITVITHVAEGAVPLKKDVDNILSKKPNLRRPNDVPGGTGSMYIVAL